MNLHDQKERLRALDPRGSFIVQAPAGSGKTELLTQRYLVLLKEVRQPEEILSITFTKKSAAEMRSRIIQSLKKAQQEPEPTLSHERNTWKLAQNVLSHDRQLGWNLLDNPNRLQVQTIDSFNASLTRQLPLLSNFGAPLEIVDDPKPLYQLAIHEFLTHLEENVAWSDAIACLLLHVDNDLLAVERLLINLLGKRDQWLHFITLNSQDPILKETLEYYLQQVVLDALTELQQSIPPHLKNDLMTLAQFAGTQLQKQSSDHLLTQWSELSDFPAIDIKEEKKWLGLCQLLLTKSKPYSFRRSFTISEGFPPASQATDLVEKKLFAEMKQRIKDLVDELSANTSFHESLKNILTLPAQSYPESQWKILAALHDILRIVVAQLKIVFQEEGKIDYIENAQAALLALGTEEEPTDLTLALDYKIQHILIDEFQDTSNSQYRLLTKLIHGWEKDDGRTLFVVGDPMQSIYRFREADVGLFIRGREKGLSHLMLEPLTLSVNFRSVSAVVNWVNTHFARIFPPKNDLRSKAVCYSKSIAAHESSGKDAVFLHALLNKGEKEQALAITQFIQKERLHHPERKIAILVRTRTHLKALIPALKAAQLNFRALNIEPLSTRPAIQDLFMLTRALLHLGDRVAWLALLRAPWCGLSLTDLLCIAQEKNHVILWEELQKKEILTNLSEAARHHLMRVMPILQNALAERRRSSLRYWIESTWLQLGGPACVETPSDLEDAEAFFNLLETLDEACDLPDLKNLQEAIYKLYAAPNHEANDFLQIMTIHNAKGLEFDTVILPHLERKSAQDDKPLLQWIERSRYDHKHHLLMAPIRAVGEDPHSIYDYITEQHRIQADHETARLLYVAATRAKQELHLFFNLETTLDHPPQMRKPPSMSLLEKLFSALSDSTKALFLTQTSSEETFLEDPLIPETKPSLKRLKTTWQLPDNLHFFSPSAGYQNEGINFDTLPDVSLQATGVVIHQILQQLANEGLSWLNMSLLRTYIQTHLSALALPSHSLLDAIKRVEKAIHNVLEDERGRWILTNHKDAQSEMPLTCIVENESVSLVIDRTFVDSEGTRWIIDYKSTEFYGNDLSQFLVSEKKHHEKKLRQYQYALQKLETRPIKMGLYFPLLPAWLEWE